MNKIFGFLFLFIMVGCTSTKSLVDSKLIDQWRLQGKIAIVYPEQNCQKETCRKKSDQGTIEWSQQQDKYSIKLSDPFGKMLYQVEGNDKKAVVTSGNEQQQIDNPSHFIAQNLKINVTPTNLRYWLTGRPDPNLPISTQNESFFVQSGFRIASNQWRAERIGKVPSLINITQGNSRLRIVVRHWSE